MILHHGTTLQRAEAIARDGPDVQYAEPGGRLPPFGFFMVVPHANSWIGSAESYARGKASLYPSEGGPVILEVDVPDEIARLALDPVGEYCFDDGYGLMELLAVWNELEKRLIPV